MAGDLAIGVLFRLVAKRQRADLERRQKPPADAFGRFGIVVAGDPDPVAAALQAPQRRAIGVGEPRRAAAVVEAVAQRHHRARRVARDQRREPGQRGRGVVGRQQHATRGEARALFEMQIGHRQQALLRPIDDTGRVGGQLGARDGEHAVRRSPDGAGNG